MFQASLTRMALGDQIIVAKEVVVDPLFTLPQQPDWGPPLQGYITWSPKTNALVAMQALEEGAPALPRPHETCTELFDKSYAIIR
jgi:hypothetical protein